MQLMSKNMGESRLLPEILQILPAKSQIKATDLSFKPKKNATKNMDLNILWFSMFVSLKNKCKLVLVKMKLFYKPSFYVFRGLPPSHGSPTLVHNHNGEPRNDIGRDG